MKKILIALMARCLALGGCQKTPPAGNSNMKQDSMANSSDSAQQPLESDSGKRTAQESAPQSEPEARPLNIDDAPVDLNDMKAVQEVYVAPLIPNGPFWTESWSSPAKIKADYLIDFCSYNNSLDLPRDFEGCYADEDRYADAEQVEAAIQKHFDVDAAYLRTATQYNAQNNTYELIGGFGGGWGMVPIFAEQEGDLITIKLGVSSEEKEDIVPTGTLTVKPDANHVVKYSSYIIDAS